MVVRSVLGVGLLNLLVAIISAQSTERRELNGTWQFNPTQSEVHSHVPPGLSWLIEQGGDSIHLVERDGDKNVSDFRCAADGKDCKVKDHGHAVNVSFYYNGPVLVELETNHDSVIKRRFQLSSPGLLAVEVIHVSPAGKPPEKLVLTQATDSHVQSLSAAAK